MGCTFALSDVSQDLDEHRVYTANGVKCYHESRKDKSLAPEAMGIMKHMLVAGARKKLHNSVRSKQRPAIRKFYVSPNKDCMFEYSSNYSTLRTNPDKSIEDLVLADK
eukprot:TRINITY_DN7216_c0_g1_i12.p1 TRINITY_DN7216_c0_g1~~TRINITY_DN7216_c0_g1_i12.p1  ORF type:complete len:108 (-),score=22.74 TRINITY_DN7216_c0_g1_i12:165-488(-)